VRNPVAAERIAHASPNVKPSEGIVHEFLPGFHNATSLDQGSGSVWMGYQDVHDDSHRRAENRADEGGETRP
jgi:hypothetical protein